MSPTPLHVAPIVAPLLLGHLWNWFLFGVLVVQLYVYSYNFPEDKALLRLFVYALFLLETLQTALSGADLYYWFISGYESVVSLSVQFYFAYRIWVLSLKKSRWLCLTICLCSIISAAAAFTSGVYSQILGRILLVGKLNAIAMIWLIGNALADILIAAAMLYHLARHKDGDRALLRIVRLTIETNIMTAFVGIVSLLMLVIFPRENWYTCPTAILGKLYSNTLLVSLNNRASSREAVARKKETAKPLGITFAITVHSEGITDSQMISRPPATFKTRSLADSETDERVVVDTT